MRHSKALRFRERACTFLPVVGAEPARLPSPVAQESAMKIRALVAALAVMALAACQSPTAPEATVDAPSSAAFDGTQVGGGN